MNYEKILQKIGLSDRESLIYIDLLENGISSISEISKRLKIHRPVIYKTIPILEESALISHTVKGKRTYYMAESPEKLRGIMENLSKSFEKTIEGLEEIYSQNGKQPSIRMSSGRKAIEQVFYDVLETLPK